jgi:Phage integrase, N-terminal SAM-like domain
MWRGIHAIGSVLGYSHGSRSRLGARTATEGASMHVQRVRMPVSGAESWTVVDADCRPVPVIEAYLAYLAALERSPNTVRAYAASLKLWFEFLGQIGVGWAGAGADDVARFVSWLRAPAANVIVLESGAGRREPATVNRHLAGVFGFTTTRPGAGPGWPLTLLLGDGSAGVLINPSCTM